MRAGRRVDELPGDADSARRSANAAFQHIAHAEFAADLLQVDGAALVCKAGIARDDEQPADARQSEDDVLHHPVSEIVLVRLSAQVQKRQHRNGRLVGKSKRWRIACRSTDRHDADRVLDIPDLTDKAHALARDGADQALLAAAVAERLARRIDMTCEGGFGDDPTTPNRLQQIVLADHALAVPDQVQQQVEDLRRQRNFFRSPHQFPQVGIEYKILERECHAGAP